MFAVFNGMFLPCNNNCDVFVMVFVRLYVHVAKCIPFTVGLGVFKV